MNVLITGSSGFLGKEVIKDLKKNEKITLSNIKKIRPSNGLHPKYFYKVIGKRTKQKILAGTPLKIQYIK